MLGGYYLGQLYLGISGLPSSGSLSVVPSSHQLSSDNITLQQKHTLIVASAAHTLASGNVTLTQKHVLAVENALHTLMSENAAITSEHFLGVADAFHGLQSTNIGITQKHSIVVNGSSHGLTSGNIVIVEHKTLVVQNATHGHTSDNLPIVVHFYLVTQNATHGHSAPNIGITQRQVIVVNNTLHAHTAQQLGGLINLQPYGLGGGFGSVEAFGSKQFGEINIELPLNFLVIPANAFHTLFDNSHSFTQKHTLDVDDSEVATDSTNVGLWELVFRYGGTYIKDFADDGEVGEEYIKAGGTIPKKNGQVGQIAPVPDANLGFLVLETGASGSFNPTGKSSGTIKNNQMGQGTLETEELDTGVYTKIK